MKHIDTRRPRRKAFAPLHATRSSQAATMTLRPGATSNESSSNEHPWAEQWLYVVSGSGVARVGRRSAQAARRPPPPLVMDRPRLHPACGTMSP